MTRLIEQLVEQRFEEAADSDADEKRSPFATVEDQRGQNSFPFQLFGDVSAGVVAKRHLIKGIFIVLDAVG